MNSGFSVLILTLNADRDLPLCLASVAGCNDIVVLDAGSTDETVPLARAAGARVFERSFDSFASQRNYAHRHIAFHHRWVFHLDADERLTPELRLECRGATWEDNVDGFLVTPKIYWDETWVRHSSGFPTPEPRFVRVPDFEFVAAGHTQAAAPQMRLGRLHTTYLHDPSRGGEDEWLARHRRHARIDAVYAQQKGISPAFSFPGRSWLSFVRHYLLRGGFRDGMAGLRYCGLLAQYEEFKREERQRLDRASRQGS